MKRGGVGMACFPVHWKSRDVSNSWEIINILSADIGDQFEDNNHKVIIVQFCGIYPSCHQTDCRQGENKHRMKMPRKHWLKGSGGGG